MTDPLWPAGSGGPDEQHHMRGDATGAAIGGIAGWRRKATLIGVDDVDGVFDIGDRDRDELLGWSAAELRCAPFTEWVHPDDRDVLAELADAAREDRDGARFWPVELRILARDRHYWWTRWRLCASGDPPAMSATGVDYVDRDDAVGPPMGTWRWDIDADTVVWSAELLDMFALTVGPPASYDAFLASIDDEDRDDVDHAVRWTLLTGESYVTDFRAAGGAGGRDRWFHAAGRLEPAAGDRIGQLCGIVKYLNPPDGGAWRHRPRL